MHIAVIQVHGLKAYIGRGGGVGGGFEFFEGPYCIFANFEVNHERKKPQKMLTFFNGSVLERIQFCMQFRVLIFHFSQKGEYIIYH
jgi:hypothetical protein